MQTIDLTGRWKLTQRGAKNSWPARVPGTVHEDLLRARAIPDPYPGLKEIDVQWVGEATWIYTREFNVPQDILRNEQIELGFDGLDTLAEVRLNGRLLGRTDNMFRDWRFDARGHLKPGGNILEVTFKPALREIERRVREYADIGRSLHTWAELPWEIKLPRGVLRKMQCNFGWDWGPVLTTAGIWQPVRIEAWNGPRLREVLATQKHANNLCEIKVHARLRGKPGDSNLRLHAELSLDGNESAAATVLLRGDEAALSLKVKNPRLWWPNGMGAQPLYTLNVELRNADGSAVDSWKRKVGFLRPFDAPPLTLRLAHGLRPELTVAMIANLTADARRSPGMRALRHRWLGTMLILGTILWRALPAFAEPTDEPMKPHGGISSVTAFDIHVHMIYRLHEADRTLDSESDWNGTISLTMERLCGWNGEIEVEAHSTGKLI